MGQGRTRAVHRARGVGSGSSNEAVCRLTKRTKRTKGDGLKPNVELLFLDDPVRATVLRSGVRKDWYNSWIQQSALDDPHPALASAASAGGYSDSHVSSELDSGNSIFHDDFTVSH